jgi:hypothetical protein
VIITDVNLTYIFLSSKGILVHYNIAYAVHVFNIKSKRKQYLSILVISNLVIFYFLFLELLVKTIKLKINSNNNN